MVNYQDGKIYKLVSFQTKNVYIGSTCEQLSARKSKHKSHYKMYLEGKINYITSIELLQFDDVDIVLLEKYPCESKEELHSRERQYIESTPNCINKYVPTRTQKQWREANTDKLRVNSERYKSLKMDELKNYKKNYYIKNKDKFKEKMKISYTCSCGSEVKLCKKARHDRTKKHLTRTIPRALITETELMPLKNI
jgi:hypothetical protein